MARDEEPPLPNAVMSPAPAPYRTLVREKSPTELPKPVCSGCSVARGPCRWHKLLRDLAEEHDRELSDLRRENADLREVLGQTSSSCVVEPLGFSWDSSLVNDSHPGHGRHGQPRHGRDDIVAPESLGKDVSQAPIFPRGRPPYMNWAEEGAPVPPIIDDCLQSEDLDHGSIRTISKGEHEDAPMAKNQNLTDGDSNEPVEMRSPRWMQDWQRRLMDVFEQIDTDCSGTIDLVEMKRVFAAAKLPPEQADEFIGEVDVSGDGVIDRIEWLHMLEKSSQGETPEWLSRFSDTLVKIQAKNGRIYPVEPPPTYHFIIRQDRPFRMIWDIFLMLLLLYIALMLPFMLGFGSSETRDRIDRIVDMFFLVDVVLNFRTSYTDQDDVMVISGRRIALHYLKSWFFLDLVSSFPFEQASSGLMPNLQPAKLLKIGKIMKVFKMLRFGKMKRVLSENEVLDELSDKLFTKSNQVFMKVGRLLVVMLLLSHWLACMMGASGDGWVKNAREDVTQIDKYLSAMYWAMTTLTTVGYGDITPFGNVEMLYAILAMVVGGSFYGYIVGKISSSMSSLDLATQAYYNRMEEVNAWLDYHSELPRSLRRRIRNYFKVTLAAKSAVADSVIVDVLSEALCHDVAFFLVQDEVRNNVLFANLPDSALSQLMPILVKCSFERGEKIVAKGEPGRSMFIIAEGSARFDQGHQWKQAPKDTKEGMENARGHILEVGDSFGEEIILQLEESYAYTVICTAKAQMFTISEQAFSERFRLMPDVRKQMISNFQSNTIPEKAQVQQAATEGLPEALTILKDLSNRLTSMETKTELLQVPATVGSARIRVRDGDDVSV